MGSDPRTWPDEEQIRYFALHHIWKRLDEPAPSHPTWSTWWRKRYGESPEDSAKRFRQLTKRDG